MSGLTKCQISEAPEWLVNLSVTSPKKENTSSFKKSESKATENKAKGSQPDVALILRDCLWMQACKKNAKSLPYLDWFQGLGVIEPCLNGNAEAHKFSEPYIGYTIEETEELLKKLAEDPKPIRCETVRSRLAFGSECEKCIFRNKLNSPIHLGFRNEAFLDWVYVNDQEKFINLRTGKMLKSLGFSNAFAHLDKGLGPKLLRKKHLIKVEGFVYEPSKTRIIMDEFDDRYLNQWHPSSIEMLEGDASVFREHVEFLFPDERHQKIFLDFISYSIQFEANKIHYALLVLGEPGTGKSYFGYVMGQLLGRQNVSTVDTSDLHGEWNAWAVNKSFVIAEELMAKNRIGMSNKLKPLITEPTFQAKIKYLNPYEVKNCLNFLMFSNHDVPLILEKRDRRTCVLDSPVQKRPKEYYEHLFKWTKNNLGVVLHFLKSRDLKDFSAKDDAPMTEAKRLLLLETEDEATKLIRGLIECKHHPFKRDIISLEDIQSSAIELPLTTLKNPQKLGRLIEGMGGKSLGPIRVGDPAKQKRLWAVRNADFWLNEGEPEVAEEYERDVSSEFVTVLRQFKGN